MKIVVINIPSSTDRRKFQEQQAKDLNLDIEFFKAITPNDFSNEDYQLLYQSWERPLSENEIGCFLSHHALWTSISQQKEPVLILEDDAILSIHLPDLLASLEKLKNIDRINLEGRKKKKLLNCNFQQILGHKLHRIHLDRAGAAGYILWPSGATKLIKQYKEKAALADKAVRLFCLRSYQIDPIAVLSAELCSPLGISPPLKSASTINSSILDPRDIPNSTRRKAIRSKVQRLFTQIAVFKQQITGLPYAKSRVPNICKTHFDKA